MTISMTPNTKPIVIRPIPIKPRPTILFIVRDMPL